MKILHCFIFISMQFLCSYKNKKQKIVYHLHISKNNLYILLKMNFWNHYLTMSLFLSTDTFGPVLIFEFFGKLIAWKIDWKRKRFGMLILNDFKNILWNLGRFLEILKKRKKKRLFFKKKKRMNVWINYGHVF